jgi:hypothetical protein
LIDALVVREDILLGNPLQLAFGEHMDGFGTLDGALGRGERPKSSPRIYAAFHQPMILVHPIVQILTLPKQTRLWEGAVVLEGLESQGVGGVLVDRDDPGRACMGGLRSAALASRLVLSLKSSVAPVESTAR